MLEESRRIQHVLIRKPLNIEKKPDVDSESASKLEVINNKNPEEDVEELPIPK